MMFLMVSFPILSLTPQNFPPLLLEIPQPPSSLQYRGALPATDVKLLSVVGSRKYTSYGKQVVDHLLDGLKGYPVGIVSGLALGIDSLAHEAALRNHLYTLAIPGGGIDDCVIYPAAHRPLAGRILEAGGGLLSEYEPTFKATRWSFIERNRLVAGISHATLIVEAGEKSGTLTTARMVADYNRELLVVPGSIFSKNHIGVHQFLKLGATPVTGAIDILTALGIETEIPPPSPPPQLSLDEARIITLLDEPRHRDELIRLSELSVMEASSLLMLMELRGLIIQEMHMYRSNV